MERHKYKTLAEFKAAFDRGEIDKSRLFVIVDNDSVSASLSEQGKKKFESLLDIEPREALHEAFALMGIPSVDP